MNMRKSLQINDLCAALPVKGQFGQIYFQKLYKKKKKEQQLYG